MRTSRRVKEGWDGMKGEDGTAGTIETRFENLESRILYQDRLVDDLNEVVTEQQGQIDSLKLEVERLRQVLVSIQEGGVDRTEEPPPPHY
ncbi:MAG: SlyX family protein [Myxococcales bacterium]